MTAGSQPERSDGYGIEPSDLPATSGSAAAADLWAAVLDRLPRGQGGAFSATLAAARAISLDRGVLQLCVPSAFYRERMSSRHLSRIDEAVRDLAPGTRVDITVERGDPTAGLDQLTLELEDERHEKMPALPGESFNPRFSFDTFVVAESNRMPHAAALSLAENSESVYNPLFIHGDPGNGKTHLLHAIGQYLRDHSPQLVVRYVTSERFTSEFTEGIRKKQLDGFKRGYRNCSVLLVDDIHFLEGKKATLEEFFHTFNDVIAAGGRVALAADRHPGEILSLPEQLRSRFSGGLVTGLQAPAPDTRVAILRKKSESAGVEVPDDVLHLLASAVTRNVRQLEGALNRVVAEATLEKLPVTMAAAQLSLQAFLGSSRRVVTLDRIIDEASGLFGFTVDELRGPSRTRPLMAARQPTMYVCRLMTEASLPSIGRAFGGRDHSTVLYSVRKVEAHMTKRTAVYDKVVALMNRLGSSGPESFTTERKGSS